MLPEPTPETRHFWDGCKAGELRLQRCTECSKSYFPPRPFCPGCGSRAVEIYPASGRATLYSYVINHRTGRGQGIQGRRLAAVELRGDDPRCGVVDGPTFPQRLGDVRGLGLLLALDLTQDIANEVVDLARTRGLLINGPRPDSLRFMPALTRPATPNCASARARTSFSCGATLTLPRPGQSRSTAT